eukprot:7944027-Alexandrium_andersonii.AAC.1
MCIRDSQLSMGKSGDWPMLKAKAWNCICVVNWLSEVCQAHGGPNRACVMWGYAHFLGILRTAD